MIFKKNVTVYDGLLLMYLVKNHFHEQHISKMESWCIENNMQGGWGNGYVGLPQWHPYFALNYDDLNNIINIHGGLTFSEMDDDEKLWIIGFDTNHYGDDLKKWTYENVLDETKFLRNQCLEVKEAQRIFKVNKLKKLNIL